MARGRFKPDVVLFNFGMNDCTAGEKGLEDYRQQLTEIVERIRAIPAIPVIQVPSQGCSNRSLTPVQRARTTLWAGHGASRLYTG